MLDSRMTQAVLWDRARGGDTGAKEELATLAGAIAARELRRRGLASDLVPDLAQEAVRSTLAYLARGGEEPKDLRAFLKFRAWGVLSDHRKRMRSERRELVELEDAEVATQDAGPDKRAHNAQLRSALADCRANLAPDLRTMLELRYERGLEADAIVRQVGIHRNTVHVRVFRALEKLRECMGRKGFEPGDLQ
jgi:RNA polymerase sigma factor (sigma-70 family)